MTQHFKSIGEGGHHCAQFRYFVNSCLLQSSKKQVKGANPPPTVEFSTEGKISVHASILTVLVVDQASKA